MSMEPQVISVSEFIGIINETLAFAYPQVVIEGEVSGFKINQQRFVFFDIKDENNTLGCFMMARDLVLPIEDGMKVRIAGSPKVTKFSRFSLTVRRIELAGEGELRRAMELLRKKLETEGLFDQSRKRPLPTFPRRIGLITSGTSAAYHDFIKILNARWGGVHVLLADVTVQGLTAPDQIVGALTYFNQLAEPADVLVLIRGGGSLEDLQAFSTEPVARAVAASRTPVIVGVGHEVDVSLADHAADLRAATPTDAARLVVPDRNEILARIDHLVSRGEHALRSAASERRARIDRSLRQFEAYLRLPLERLEALTRNLSAFESLLLTNRRHQVQTLDRVLRSLNPAAVLGRGYAIVRRSGAILRDPATARADDPIDVQLAEGSLTARVTKHP
jgi:exodeoxyribonuclease VII large subunit